METKNWWQSKTIWAAIIAALSGLVSFTGHTIDPGTQGVLVNQVSAVADAITIVAGVVAGFSRATATTSIVPVVKK